MKATFVKTKPESVIVVSKIVTIHDFEFDSHFSYAGESHDFWEMVYVDKGKVAILRGEEELILGQGEILFHCPNEFHAARSLDSAPHLCIVSFECRSAIMQSFVKWRTLLDKSLRPFIASIINEAKRTYILGVNNYELAKLEKREGALIGGEQLIKTYLEQLLIMLLRQASEQKEASVFPSRESMETHIVTSVKQFIESNKERVLRLGEICRKFGYSKTYLCKLFREQTGYTIVGYVSFCRVQYAKQLIREGQLNFTQISDKLSFDNPQYFTRVFRRVTGMSPSEYKQAIRRD